MSAWLQLALPPALRGFPGVFHCPWYGLPLVQPVPMVVTIHDVSFEIHPEWFPRSRLYAYRAQARWAARTAAHVLTDAIAIRAELLAHYRLDPAKVTVATPTVEADRANIPDDRIERVATALGLPSPYVVAIGGAERRNLDATLAAWPAVHRAHPDVSLVVLGDSGATNDREAGVHVLTGVDDDTWISVIAGAEVLAYPTRYEGFGYPAAEALVNGVPVACAPVGSLPEVVGDAGKWMREPTTPELAGALTSLLGDGAALEVLQHAAKKRSRKLLDPTHLAEATLHAYQVAASAGRA